MAPPSARRRTRDELEDDRENLSSADDSDDAPPSSSPKRPRLDGYANGHVSDDSDSPPRSTMNGPTQSPTDFQPGAIVRVSVENFVTYAKAEFFPGPNLNMVIGPNGTGKSSLVCAICLGLGYSPRHLGRAGSVKEFVKHGKDTATIEIELKKKPQDRSNYVVRVVIRREQNSQKWWLNGKETTHKKIQSLMKSLKIQVDNLCQFLPQDRVVEFAACTPVDLLHETLRAAAHEEMLTWQDQLRDLHKDKKEMASTANSDNETLKNLENRQQGLQADVDRIREREEIAERIRCLKPALILAKYQKARDDYRDAKDRKKEAQRQLKQLERDLAPSLEMVNRKQEYATRVQAAVSGRREALREAEIQCGIAAKEVEKASEAALEFENKLQAEQKGFESKKKDLGLSRSKINAYQADMKNRPAEFSAADWNQKIRAEEHIQRDLAAQLRQADEERLELRTKGRAKTQELTNAKQDMVSFDTQEGQQLNFMKRTFPELATGWEWIQHNQDQFEHEVFGPPMISCSMKDERYSDQVQSLLQNDDFCCFTAQSKNDYKKLTDQLYRVMSLSTVIRTCLSPLESFRRPVDEAEASELGLDGFAIDYIEGPAPVLAMLCAEKRLHQCGVSLKDHDDAQYDRIVNNGKVSSWATNKQSYTIRRRREYGPQAMTIVTKNIMRGRYWTSQPVDAHEKAELGRRLAELTGEIDILRQEMAQVNPKIEDLRKKVEESEKKSDQLRSEKNALQKEYQKWQSLPDKLESEERLRDEHERALRAARDAMTDLQYQWDEAAVKRSEITLQHKESVEVLRNAHRAFVEAQIWLVEANSDVQGLKDRNAGIVQRLEQEKQTVQVATDDAAHAREQAESLGVEVQNLPGLETDFQTYQDLAKDKSPEDVEHEIGAEEAKLELIHAANPSVIRDFEKRAQDIARLRRKLDGLNEKLEGLNAEVDELMDKWEPRLDELISRINDAFAYNFEQISCAGEVRVHKDEDFEQWALDIMVKFRENEDLQKLTAHRQSGGERAVSTIFYLMALQSLAQSPFRVVDEINQGMDPRNERMVHERMVEIACREHTSQYFLITPKLLTGLRYDPRMRVLCIASGEYMPRDGKKLDFARCLRVQKGLMAGA